MDKFDDIIDEQIVRGECLELIEGLTPLEKVEFIDYLWELERSEEVNECFKLTLNLV